MEKTELEQMKQDMARLAFVQGESGYNHFSYEEEMRLFEYIKQGNLQAVQETARTFNGEGNGKLSEDPLRNAQFLFVAAITTACRFCIEGGMPMQESYNLSDLYIQRMDRLQTVEEVAALNLQMVADYTQRMAAIRKSSAYSRPVRQAMDYILAHLHERITMEDLTEILKLSRSYFSTLFAKEVGVPVSDYVRRQKLEAAKGMLENYDYSIADISEYFAFANESHFSNLFRRYTGLTPKEYREQNYQKHYTREGAHETREEE